MKCKCGKDAVYVDEYSNTAKCKSHFIRYFQKVVKKSLRSGGWLRNGQKVKATGERGAVFLDVVNSMRNFSVVSSESGEEVCFCTNEEVAATFLKHFFQNKLEQFYKHMEIAHPFMDVKFEELQLYANLKDLGAVKPKEDEIYDWLNEVKKDNPSVTYAIVSSLKRLGEYYG